jgi:hypothetical protein
MRHTPSGTGGGGENKDHLAMCEVVVTENEWI